MPVFCTVLLSPFIFLISEVTFRDTSPEHNIPVMINRLGKDRYGPKRVKNAENEIYEERETCKTQSESLWPSHHQIAHTMWQESIYRDERLKGKKKNVWKHYLGAVSAKLFNFSLWTLIAVFTNMEKGLYCLFCLHLIFTQMHLEFPRRL